jgi:hypothetical protein
MQVQATDVTDAGSDWQKSRNWWNTNEKVTVSSTSNMAM